MGVNFQLGNLWFTCSKSKFVLQNVIVAYGILLPGREDTFKSCSRTSWCRGCIYRGRDSWRGRKGGSSEWNAQVKLFGSLLHFVMPCNLCFYFIYLVELLSVRSIFCLNPAGDTPSSARLFDAIVSGCIPVIVSDELELPFEGILDYRKVCISNIFC